jgi:dTDP-4-amino-4,6-dideoxygalactose transaminase
MRDEYDCRVRIPLVDLKSQYLSHKEEFDAAVAACVEASSFIGGPDHEAFAAEFSRFCDGAHVALCGSGTAALSLSLRELLGPGDGTGEVITVSHTFVATAEAIVSAGYVPRLVDVDGATCLMDLDGLEAAITPRSRAIVPVHLYGQMVAMDRLMEIADRHRLPVIEDAAQAHGATWQGRTAGQWGAAACFSFYPGKNLGAWGDAGAVVSRDAALIERLRMRFNHGRRQKFENTILGVNSRLDGLQAAILRVKLRHLDEWNRRRRAVAAQYDRLLGEIEGLQLPRTEAAAEHVFHLYVIQVADRDRVRGELDRAGVATGIHYPIPVHEQPAFADLKVSSHELPRTAAVARRVLSLPMYPELSDDQVAAVARVVAATMEALR